MILCDTNIFIEIYRGNFEIIHLVESIGQHNIAISDVTCAELLYGARNKKELQAIRNDMDKLTELPIVAEISNMAVQLIEKYALSYRFRTPASCSVKREKMQLTLKYVKEINYINWHKLQQN
ncbi:MAG: PIN domain-containing protein [Saprospiraceae bacterium]